MANRKPIRINLNDYEHVKTESDLKEHVGLIIIPQNNLPPMYFRKPIKVIEIEDVDNAVWFKDIRISKNGEQHEYAKRVEWWFNQALNDRDYKELINQMFNRNGYDVKKDWEKAKCFLIASDKTTRKTYIHQFINKWMTRGMNRQIEYNHRKTKGY